LLKKKYLEYILLLTGVILLIVIFDNIIEYSIYYYLGTTPGEGSIYRSGLNFMLDSSSSFILNIMAAIGLSVTVLFKQWMIEGNRVAEMEKIRLKSETEQLKEQISPNFLFKILNRTGTLAKTEPEKASEMLMRLSRMLRYQLYDCSRDKILLSTVINFLSDYLELERLYDSRINFEIIIKGYTQRIFVPPLIFLPFVQDTVKSIPDNSETYILKINFEVSSESISFSCNTMNKNTLTDPNLTGIRKRLELLYGKMYSLELTKTNMPDIYSLKLHIKK